jgi:CBS domain containing-hemolysin-like protein
MMSVILISLAVLLFAVLFQALFAGYETGFLSINPLRIRFMAEEERQRLAKRMIRYMSNPDQMLAMLLIGTNVGTVIGAIAVTRGLRELVPPGLVEPVAILIATPVFLLFAEVIPKSVFRQLPNRLSLAFLPVIEVFYWVFSPLAWPLAKLSRLLFRFASDHQEHHLSPLMVSREDMRVLVDESADHGTIEPEEQRMIHSVINLQATQAKEIMVPRIDIQALPETASRAELLALLEQSGRTRIPVYRETIDEVVGVVSAHDVLLDANPTTDDIRPYIRDVMHVPDTIKVDDLFAQMKQGKQYMTIVTDEYGGTDGLITLEDILEEIFGDIQDEHDAEEKQIQSVGQNAFVIDARAYLEDVSEAIGVIIEDEEVETIGGWLMRAAGRIPHQGEVIIHGRFRITVLDGGINSIVKLRLEVLPQAEGHHA